MAGQYKMYSTKQTYILPFVEFSGSLKKKKRKKNSLEVYNLCSSYQIYYSFPSISFSLDMSFNSSLQYAHVSCDPIKNIKKTQYLNISYLIHYFRS